VVKLMMFDKAFNEDGASASSWMVGVVYCIVGESKITFVRKMCLRLACCLFRSQRNVFSSSAC
jgi:hypothetical protein